MITTTTLRPSFRFRSGNGDFVALGVHGNLLVATVPITRFKFAEPGTTILLPLPDVLAAEGGNVVLRNEELEHLRYQLRASPERFRLERVDLTTGRPDFESGSGR